MPQMASGEFIQVHKQLKNLSLADLEILAILPRYKSLRALARDLHVTPSHISSKIAFLEQEFDTAIAQRSTTGFALTRDGAQLGKAASDILGSCEKLVSISRSENQEALQWLTFGSRGFVNTMMAPILSNESELLNSNINFRFVDFSPEEIVVAAFKSSLDIAVTLEKCFLGEKWQSSQIGTTKKVLLVRKNHKLERSQDLSDLENYRVLRSSYWDGNTVVSSGDLLPKLSKKTGCEVQTAATAIQVILQSDCVAFLPRIAAASALQLQQLVEVFSNQTECDSVPVFLHVNKDTVQQKTFKRIWDITERAVKKYG